MISKRILQNLNELRLRDKLCDLQLLSKDGEAFNLHKCVFIAACKRQFDIVCSRENEMHTSKMSKMILPQVSANELKAMISFIYGETTQDTQSPDLLSTLSKLNMVDLLENEGQSATGIQIKQEPGLLDVSVIVDVQVSKVSEHLSPVTEAPFSESEDFQIFTAPGLAPDDLDGNNSDIEFITLGLNRITKAFEPVALESTKSTDPVDFNTEENCNIEILSLKQECEELANNDPAIVEVKTEEDEHIERLMDVFSNELDLLKTPDQIPNSPIITVEIDGTERNNVAEKVKANLFPSEAEVDDLASTTDILLASELATQTIANHLVIPTKTASPIKDKKDTSTDTQTGEVSTMKEFESKSVSSKYKMILPRVSYQENIQALSSLLSPSTRSNEISQNKKVVNKNCSDTNNHADKTRKREASGKSRNIIEHKTIARLLALPPLMLRTDTDEKKMAKENDSNAEMPKAFVNKKNTESSHNENVENNDKEKKVVCSVESLSQSQNSSICTEVAVERDFSLSSVQDKTVKNSQKISVTKQADVENSGSLISRAKFEQLHQKKKSVRRNALRLGYKHRNKKRKLLNLDHVDCKETRKKSIDFGVGQNKGSTPVPARNRAVRNRKPASEPVHSGSPIHSGILSVQDSEKESTTTTAPTTKSLSEQVHEARDRKRRRKALHPTKRADKTDNGDGNVKVEQTSKLTENINTLMQSATEIIGPESDCSENAVKILADLSITDSTASLLTNKDNTVTETEILTEGNIDKKIYKMPVHAKKNNVSVERNDTKLKKDDNLRSAIAKASPLLVKLLSAIRKTETVGLRKCLSKDKDPTSRSNSDKHVHKNPDTSAILDPGETNNEAKTTTDRKDIVPAPESPESQTMIEVSSKNEEHTPECLESKTVSGKAVSADKEPTPVPNSSRDLDPKSVKDQISATSSVSEEKTHVSKSLEGHNTKLAPVSTEVPSMVSETLQNKVDIKPASVYSPEIVKLLQRKIDNFGPQNNDTQTANGINKERQGVFEVFNQPAPNSNVENIKDPIDLTIAEIDQTENMTEHHEELIAVKEKSTGADLKENDNNNYTKRPRKGRPKKHNLSVKQLLHIQPKLPQMVLKPNLHPTLFKTQSPITILSPSDMVVTNENSQNQNKAKLHRKRSLSKGEASDLVSAKKSKNVENEKKQKPKVKERNSMDLMDHTGDEILLGNLHVSVKKGEDNDGIQSSQNIPQGSSETVAHDNQKSNSIKSQPVKIAPKPSETGKPKIIPDVSELLCMKKCRSNVGMKKPRPKVKRRNSLDPVGHSNENYTSPSSVDGSILRGKDQGKSHVESFLSASQSISVEIVDDNGKTKHITSPPSKMSSRTTDTCTSKLTPVSKPTLIVMEPSTLKSRMNGKSYYARPLFRTEQVVKNKIVSQTAKSDSVSQVVKSVNVSQTVRSDNVSQVVTSDHVSQSVLNGKLKYYAKPLIFGADQMVESNTVSQKASSQKFSSCLQLKSHSEQLKIHKNTKEVGKTAINEKGLNQAILETFQSYRLIAPKRPNEK